MNSFYDSNPRQIIPRWRDFETTAKLGELADTRTTIAADSGDPDEVRKRLAEWELNRTAPFAADLLSAALAARDLSVAADAIAFLTSPTTTVSSLARRVALNVMRPSGVDDLSVMPPPLTKALVQSIIRDQKARVRFEPRDSLAWAELARGYVLLGFPAQANQAMMTAVAIAPDNRFLLRSAARLLVHSKDYDGALRLLRRSPASAHDSWLISAEIATAGLCGKTPKLTKAGLSLMNRDELAPFHVTELASALGTIEASSGSYQRARKLFRRALERPNENSVAQALWAARTSNVVSLEAGHFQVPLSFEARSQYHLQNQQWSDAYRETINWLNDQPFARWPAIQASYIAAVILEDYAAAVDVIEFGQIANPHDWTLRNNLAFAYASSDQVEKAELVFRALPPLEGRPEKYGVWLATAGLIEFRAGRFDRGVTLYRAAMDEFSRAGMINSKALAAAFLAREAIRAKMEFASEAAASARDVASVATAPEIPTLLSRLDEGANQPPP